ncbi:hypothetical protein BYT27DRAFT_7020706, partial [Phlegmacium glaucopus]
SICRDSGIGDHGPEGIKTFTAQHHCNHICRGLKLAPLSEDERGDSDDKKSED